MQTSGHVRGSAVALAGPWPANQPSGGSISTAEPPPSAAAVGPVPVTLLVSNCLLNFGEQLRLAGSCPELGGWDSMSAPLLQWQPGNCWVAEVALPPGQHACKLVLVREGGDTQWEQGRDRLFSVPAGARSMTVSLQFGDTASTQVAVETPPPAPRSVSMAAIAAAAAAVAAQPAEAAPVLAGPAVLAAAQQAAAEPAAPTATKPPPAESAAATAAAAAPAEARPMSKPGPQAGAAVQAGSRPTAPDIAALKASVAALQVPGRLPSSAAKLGASSSAAGAGTQSQAEAKSERGVQAESAARPKDPAPPAASARVQSPRTPAEDAARVAQLLERTRRLAFQVVELEAEVQER